MDPFDLIEIIDDLKIEHSDFDMQDRLNVWKRKVVEADIAGVSYYKEFISDLEKEKFIIEEILKQIKIRKK